MKKPSRFHGFILLLAATLGTSGWAAAPSPCRIQVVEKGSGWPVPLVELRTTHLERFVTDNAGVIAFDSPELLGRETWFDVLGNGYEVPRDGFGYRGVRLKPEPGKTLTVEGLPNTAQGALSQNLAPRCCRRCLARYEGRCSSRQA